MTQAAATKSDLENLRSAVELDIQRVDMNIQRLEARMLTAIAKSSSRTIVTVLGFTVPLLIASGLLQHFWK